MVDVGTRELRADLAAHVRRAAAGEPVRVRVNGRIVAILHSADAPSGAATVEQLIATGALVAPRRGDGAVADGAIRVWRQVRLDLALREVRG